VTWSILLIIRCLWQYVTFAPEDFSRLCQWHIDKSFTPAFVRLQARAGVLMDVTSTTAVSVVAISVIGAVLGLLWKFRSETLKIQSEFSKIAADKQAILDSEIVNASAEVFSRVKDMARLGSQLELGEEDRQRLTKIVFTATNLNTVRNEISRTTDHFTYALISGAIFIGMMILWSVGSFIQIPPSGPSLGDVAGWTAWITGFLVFWWGVLSMSPSGRFKKMNQELESAVSFQQLDSVLKAVLKDLSMHYFKP
jgi:Flp pilus assembly protein TadB